MKLRDPRLWLSLVSLAIVLLLTLRDVSERVSPGPLAPVHAALPELQGSEGCDACHGVLDEGLDAACQRCHEPVREQLAAGAGLHGGLAATREAGCARCHLEHLGGGVPLAGELAFERAGLEGPAGFAHGHTDFGLAGRHAALECSDCHAAADAPVLAAGTPRYLGLSQRCASCHEDPHGGAYTEDCARCHGQEAPFADAASFRHEAFPLEGVHAGPDCAACHEPRTPRSVSALLGADEPPAARACAACHESPHAEAFVLAAAAGLGAAPDASCVSCHDTERADFASGTLERALHAASGFPLEAPHAEVACAACHGEAADGRGFAARFPGRDAASCEACHEDPHGGQFERGAFAGASCSTCHGGAGFHPSTFDALLHGRTAFALEGAHLDAECAGCHGERPRVVAERVFAAADPACASCHEDAHGGRLRGALAGEGCGACHGPTRFGDVDREGFDHGACTAFALTGAHAAAACEACHAPAAAPDALGRVFGRVSEEAARAAAACEACHEDVHGGSFDGPSVAAPRAEAAGCARCHTTASFVALAGAFDHGGATGFALEGAHLEAECAGCHDRGEPVAGRRLGRVAAPAGGAQACSACHEDPHDGRFELSARAGDCGRCHGTVDFAAGAREGFRHGPETGFALAGAHAGQDCAACHGAAPAGSALSLGPAAGARCADCHEDPHAGQFARAGRVDCARCHLAEADGFAARLFDHGRDARFELDAQHAALECAACHRPARLADGREVVRYRPLGRECADCHGTAGGPR